MPQNEKVILYVIATPEDYPTLKGRALMYTVRGTVYYSPLNAEGLLDVGAAISVYAEDADELIQKSRFRTKQQEQRYAFTRSASEAALRKEAWLKGEKYTPESQPASEFAVTPDLVMLQAQTMLSDDQLKQLLAQRGVKIDEPAVTAAPPMRTRKPSASPPPVTVTGDED